MRTATIKDMFFWRAYKEYTKERIKQLFAGREGEK